MFCFVCLSILWGGSFAYGQDVFYEAPPPPPDRYAKTAVEPQEKLIPYGGVCFLNYGFSLDFHAGYRQTYQRGSGSFNDDDTLGTEINWREDLGLDRYVVGLAVGGGVSWNGFRLGFEYNRAKFEGDRILSAAVTIDSTTYAVSTRLDSEFKLDWYRLTLGATIYSNSKVGFSFDLELDAIEVSYDFRGSDPTTGTLLRESDRRIIPLAKPGFRFDFALSEPVVCTLALNGMFFRHKGVYLESIYTSFTGRWYLNKTIFVFGKAAYDFTKITSQRDDQFDGKLVFQSYFLTFGLGLNF